MKNEPQIPMKSSLELPRKPYPTRLSDAANRLPYSEKYPYLEVEDMDVEDIANCLYNVEKYFGRGLQIYRSALAAARAKQVQAELTNARLIHHNLESISRIFKAYTLLNSEKTDIRAFKKILQNEITNLELALPLLRNEKRFGKSIPYGKMFFSETDVKQKLKTLKEELKYTETPG
jgi:hypothetical protein